MRQNWAPELQYVGQKLEAEICIFELNPTKILVFCLFSIDCIIFESYREPYLSSTYMSQLKHQSDAKKKVFPVREQSIPMLGIKRSHAGNKSFPYWEQNVPLLGFILLL